MRLSHIVDRLEVTGKTAFTTNRTVLNLEDSDIQQRIAVARDDGNPEIYHLYVGMLWNNGSPPGGASHYPKVERIDSVAGGLSMDPKLAAMRAIKHAFRW